MSSLDETRASVLVNARTYGLIAQKAKTPYAGFTDELLVAEATLKESAVAYSTAFDGAMERLQVTVDKLRAAEAKVFELTERSLGLERDNRELLNRLATRE